jgi:hypothetical protein
LAIHVPTSPKAINSEIDDGEKGYQQEFSPQISRKAMVGYVIGVLNDSHIVWKPKVIKNANICEENGSRSIYRDDPLFILRSLLTEGRVSTNLVTFDLNANYSQTDKEFHNWKINLISLTFETLSEVN